MNIAVFFGGKSCEHNISVATGVSVANYARELGHNVICVYIDKKGRWLSSDKFFDINAFKCSSVPGHSVFLKGGDNRLYFGALKKIRLDCAVLCNHGKNGEDGTLQGALALSNIPFTGSDVLGSAVGMDKIIMKRLFRAAKIPTVKSVDAYKHMTLSEIAALAEKQLSFPMIVKPSNLGSSIGIEVAHSHSELLFALNVAFEWDTRVIIEQALSDFTELNCAVLGDCSGSITGVIERPVSAGEFLSYDEKYHSGLKISGAERMPELDKNLSSSIKNLAKRAFNACACSGVARVDFMLDNKSGKLYVNEINTIPGSLSVYLFPSLSGSELVSRLIDLALTRHGDINSLRYVYEDSSFSKKYK